MCTGLTACIDAYIPCNHERSEINTYMPNYINKYTYMNAEKDINVYVYLYVANRRHRKEKYI